MALPSNLQRALDEERAFHTSTYLKRGFQLVNQNLGLFIVFTLLFFIISGAVGMLLTPINLAIAAALSGILAQVVSQLLGQLVNPAVTGPLGVGFANAAHKLDRGKAIEFGDFFAGFSRWKDLYLVAVITGLVGVLAFVPAYFYWSEAGIDVAAMQGNQDPEFWSDFDWIGMLVGVAIGAALAALISVLFVYASMFVWFYNQSALDALSLSVRLARKHYFDLLGLVVVFAGLAIGGVITCCVGLFYAVPVISCSLYAAFADQTDLNAAAESDNDVIDHFAPQA